MSVHINNTLLRYIYIYTVYTKVRSVRSVRSLLIRDHPKIEFVGGLKSEVSNLFS